MKLTRTSVLAASSLLIGGFMGASALVALAGWTNAPANPPSNNAAAPVNVGGGDYPAGDSRNYSQTKTGLLGLGNFQFVPPGMPATGTTGKVLTAIDDFGTVGWGNAGGGQSIHFITPVSITLATPSGTWSTFNASPYIPSTNVSAVILQYYAQIGQGQNEIDVRQNSSAQSYPLIDCEPNGSSDTCTVKGMGFGPINSDKTFQYAQFYRGGSRTLQLVGYVGN
ncbi:MAG TPA: hypothetical protein VL335_01795 [Candidatus Paceibacterota bacterium]|nr:hypothetical protein [Candidatus Paceibacterota bacterium]